MAGEAWLRVVLLCVAPVVTLLMSAGSLLFAFTCASSLLATGFDVVRQRRRSLPFPIYLLIIYALQTYSLMALPTELGGAAGIGFEFGGGESSLTGSLNAQATAGPRIQTMSVVMAAHNEHQYMTRTLSSLYGNTPPSVLKEIIIIDDASTPPLAKGLADFPHVKILRHEQRRGLIKSKTEGGNIATSDMIMFLDAHVKPEPDWWKPLLRHMNTNYKRVVVPIIPILNPDTWQPNLNAVGTKMMFDWTLYFQWFEDHNDLVPCMSGGLFGITRKWWHESGEYDYGMRMWGAENIEQSIRVWLCGGEIYVARDSKVSHVFRSSFPYDINNTEIYLNKVRTVEAWFDEYKENYYRADPAARQFIRDIGDLSDRLALKKKLHCKPFKWYIEKFRSVFADMHMLPEDVFLFRDKNTNRCLQASVSRTNIFEASCNKDSALQQWAEVGKGQGFRSVAFGYCLDANAGVEAKEGSKAFLFRCTPGNDMQDWKFQRGHLRWRDFCIQGSAEGALELTKCADFLQSTGEFELFERHSATGPGQFSTDD